MVDQRLVNYITSELSRGIALEQIIKVLIAQGWSSSDINEAVDLARQQRPLPTASAYEDPAKKSHKLWIILVLIVAAVIGVFVFLYLNGTEKCIESWQCRSWSPCTDNSQTRICYDNNECGTTEKMPFLVQECAPP